MTFSQRKPQLGDVLNSICQGLMDAYGYQQIRLPMVEQTNLFKRSIGDATDIVEKKCTPFWTKVIRLNL